VRALTIPKNRKTDLKVGCIGVPTAANSKFATRAVCDYPHGPWGVLTTAGSSQRNDPPKARSQDHAAAVTPRQGGHTGMAVQKPALNVRSGFAQVQVPLDY
jgi:hypothetical protein